MRKSQMIEEKRARMFELVKLYHKSGQTQRQFCHSNQLKYSTFQFWLKKYRSLKTDTPEKRENIRQSFMPLTFSPPILGSSQGSFTIEYPGGIRICMDRYPGIDQVRELFLLKVS